jgi:hypothetical protein
MDSSATHIYLNEHKISAYCKWYFMVDPHSGQVVVKIIDQAQEEDWHACGHATYQQVGLLLGRKKLFLALYAYKNTMLMRIGDQVFDWADTSLHVKRDGIAPFVKRFRVFRDKAVVASFFYLYTDLLGTAYDETYGTDFPTYIEDVTATRAKRERFIYFWTEVSKGRGLRDPVFQKELEQIEKNMSSQSWVGSRDGIE